MAHETPIPRALASRQVRIIRPRDARDIYANPGNEFARLAKAGILTRIAHGYYAVPPIEAFGDPRWRPTPESVALGVGQADHGRDRVALVGISASRLLGIPPRAIAVGIVAIPTRRRPLETTAGRVVFWTRDVATLDTQSAKTELARGWATTPEQTLLDIAERPGLGGITMSTASETMWQLAPRADWLRVHRLSISQHRPAAYARARWVCSGLVSDDAPSPLRQRRPASSHGLSSWNQSDAVQFGIAT
jgi:predicted transcriptional regulator of viral defense system